MIYRSLIDGLLTIKGGWSFVTRDVFVQGRLKCWLVIVSWIIVDCSLGANGGHVLSLNGGD